MSVLTTSVCEMEIRKKRKKRKVMANKKKIKIENKSEMLGFSIFAVVGLLVLIIGVVRLISGVIFMHKAVQVEATVSSIDATRTGSGNNAKISYTPFISYEYKGKTYENVVLNEYNATMKVGGKITVSINPDNPSEVQADSNIYVANFLMILIGAIFASVGLIAIVPKLKKMKKQSDAVNHGKRVVATVDEVVYKRNYKVNGRSPYLIYCTYEDENTGIKYKYKSNYLWTDPSEVYYIGSNIFVYINEKDYSEFYVDVDAMLNQRVVDFTE
jgi:hypothetical protein